MLDPPKSWEIYEESIQNGALAALRNGHPDECISFLSRSSKDEKYFFRYGQAYFLKHDYKNAEKHFNKVLKINPRNTKAFDAIKLCQRKFQMKYKKMLELMREHGMVRNYSLLFHKFGLEGTCSSYIALAAVTNGCIGL